MKRRSFVLLLVALAGCRACEGEREEEEERDQARDHYWRAQIRVVGEGAVRTHAPAFDCTPSGGECGPKLVTYKELAPPAMMATASPGYRFDHWESSIVALDGAIRAKRPIPDGPIYIDGFGYQDTGELETVTAVFVREAD